MAARVHRGGGRAGRAVDGVKPLAIDLYCGLGGWTKIPLPLSRYIARCYHP